MAQGTETSTEGIRVTGPMSPEGSNLSSLCQCFQVAKVKRPVGLGLPSSTQGVVITNLDPASPAAQAGLQQGDVIESISRQPVRSVADFERLAAQAKGETLLRINRQGSGVFLVISPTGDDQ